MTVNFGGNVYDDAGNAVNGASVKLLETGTTTQEGSTVTTDSNGRWDFSEADQDRYDVEITSGSSVRRIKWSDEISLKEIDVRNNTGEGTPAATFSNITSNVDDMEVVHYRALRGTGAADDNMFFRYYMNDDGGNVTEVARMTVNLVDAGAATEDAKIIWSVVSGASMVDALTISSSASAAQSIDFNQDSITFGTGTAATDITLTFDAESADGVITWMEDEDYFKFSDDILMNSTERINFYDEAIYIYSSTDGQLDLVADTEIQIAATTIDINGAVALDGAITGATNITLSGELDAATLDISSSADIAGDLVLSGGADGALQFTNAGENSIKIPDNQASALIIEEADNAYITFVTTNSSEAITVAKATTFSAGIADAGTIAAGTWNGTDVGVAYGGTGASSLTDGGVLLGSGTSAVTAMAVLADGEMIVGDGTTDPVAESGATLRTSIGVGTGDAVEFAGITGTTIDATTDFTIGTTIITDDSIVMTPSTSDTVTIAAATNGVLNITTVDNAAAAANIQITADGTAELAGTTVTLDSAGNIALDATDDVIVPADVGILFGGSGVGEKIEGDGTDLTISGNKIKLSPASGEDVLVANNTGLIVGHTGPLQVAGSVTPKFQVLGTATYEASMLLANFQNNDNGPLVIGVGSNNTSIAAGGIVTDNKVCLELRGAIDDSNDLQHQTTRISMQADGDPTYDADNGTKAPGKIIFSTNTGAAFNGSPTPHITINKSGAIGIGSSPDYGTSGEQLTTGESGSAVSWAAASSRREDKDIIGLASPDEALQAILNSKAYNFRYKDKKGTGDTSTNYIGLMADEAPWAMHYNGTIVNPVNTLGYTVLAFQEMERQVEDLKERLAAIGG